MDINWYNEIKLNGTEVCYILFHVLMLVVNFDTKGNLPTNHHIYIRKIIASSLYALTDKHTTIILFSSLNFKIYQPICDFNKQISPHIFSQ